MHQSNDVLVEAERTSPQAMYESEYQEFLHAEAAQRERALGAAFAHRCLTALIWVGAALVLALIVIAGLGWAVAHPPIKYFATENGRVVAVQPTDKPAFSDSDVSAFGADSIRKSFTLDFTHYREQINNVKDDYDDQGYVDYYKALSTSNVLSAVKDQRMNLSVDVGPGVIRSKGLLGENFTWEYQYPVTLKLDGQVTSSPAQRFIFTQRMQRTDVQVKNKGLEVIRIITTGAN